MTDRIHLPVTLTDADAAALKGHYLDDREHYDPDLLIGGRDVTVLKPDGSPLLVFRHRALDGDLCRAALPALRRVPVKGGNNRQAAAGGGKRRRLRDGTISRTTHANPVETGQVGWLGRTARHPYCRTTAFTRKEVERWPPIVEYARAVDRVFAESVPGRFAAQRAVADVTEPDWLISDTAFTTVTVNRNWRTAAHTDKGDLREGFGVMTALGDFIGGHLVFPKFLVAVAMRPGDVLLADVHELHGNTPMHGERISTVMYYIAKMRHCGTPEQELHRAKRRRPGDPLY